MWKTKILAPCVAVAVAMMLLAMSAAPVIAAGAKYQMDIAGKAKQSGGNYPWQSASVVLADAVELPAYAVVTIGGVPYQEEIATIQYAYIPDGVQGVNIGTMWINFTYGGSISGTIESGWKTMDEPCSYMYFEVVGMGGRVYITSLSQHYNFAGMSGTVEISHSGSVIPPE